MEQSSYLLSLPAEIRCQIYRHLFINCCLRANAAHYPEIGTPADIREEQHQFPPNTKRKNLQPPSPVVNIFLACRKLHREALPIFYSHVKFVFRRHSTDAINWNTNEVRACFPSHTAHDSKNDKSSNRHTIDLVRYVYYAGNEPAFVRTISHTFPSLKSFEFDLDWDHAPGDQTNFDYAIKYLKRHKEWQHIVKSAFEIRFPDGMARAVFDLQKQGPARGFPVTLHWRIGWRFLEFAGDCDLDEWCLQVYNADLLGTDAHIPKHYFKQESMFYEMG